MRNSVTSRNTIIANEDSKPYGVFLAADFCGQHEHGIEQIEREFGIDRSKPGIPGRTITRCPDICTSLEKTVRLETSESKPKARKYKSITATVLVAAPYVEASALFDRMLKPYPGQECEIIGAFDDGSFAMTGYTDEANAAIKMIIEGLDNLDLAIMMGGGNANPFDRGGLVLARASMIPVEMAKVTLDADLEAIRLAEAADATGIKAKLDASRDKHRGFSLGLYYALSPAWVDKFQSVVGREGRPIDQTKHPVMFFLNPTDQKKNNHGWFTVEELELWLEGKGPIIKEQVDAQQA